MTPDQLRERIRLGQDSELELKELRISGERIQGPPRDELADELAAFANSRGGLLVLGVADKTRDVVGIPAESLDTVERFVIEVCIDSVRPPLAPHVRRILLPNADREMRAVRLASPKLVMSSWSVRSEARQHTGDRNLRRKKGRLLAEPARLSDPREMTAESKR